LAKGANLLWRKNENSGGVELVEAKAHWVKRKCTKKGQSDHLLGARRQLNQKKRRRRWKAKKDINLEKQKNSSERSPPEGSSKGGGMS